ncbi:MAG: peptidoglycan DD-metalloendopeptidase family protein [Ignavibacteria bacterium]
MKTILILLFLQIAVLTSGQSTKIGNDLYLYSQPDPVHNCTPEIKFDPAIHENVAGPYDGSNASFIWPFDVLLDQGIVLVNYVDDLSGGSIKDYNDNDWSYNGHNGTDLCLHDFRNMDRFYSVKAAESGTVVQIEMNNPDRNTAMGGDPANIVLIRHDDGSYAYYYHLMRKSVLVKLGEYVLQGKEIGYVGSSGSSTDAHLHFEPGYFTNGNWNKRDPWQGTYNHLASMWQNQPGYIGFRDFKMHDMGVFTAGQVGGNMANLTFAMLKERLITPNTVSCYEDKIGFWMQFQCNNTGKQIRFELRNSNGVLIDDVYFFADAQNQYAWSWWTPNFNPGISATGDWYVRLLYDNVEKGRYFFNVQLLTSNRPRLYPVAGKCFRRTLLVQKDTLRVRPVRSNMQYDLLNAPPNVTITNDSIINISTLNQTFREKEFKVIASIGGSASLRDTMIYKLIDTTKEDFTGNGIVSLELFSPLEGRWNGSVMEEDTVTVLLRAPLSPFNVVDSARVNLSSNGFCIANFPNANSGIYYYIVVKHRNSIETWAKTVQQFPLGHPLSYDFRTSSTKAYGNNLKYKGGEYCIYTGDTNQDGIIDAADMSMVDNDISFFVQPYNVTDLDGDRFVDASDLSIVDNNAFNAISVMKP